MKINQYAKQDYFEKCPKIIMIILSVITFVMLAGCNPLLVTEFEKPDLIPEGRSDAEGPNAYCNLNDNGELVVKVRNQTNIDILVPTETTVIFSPGGSSTQITPPMPGGSSFTHTFIIPTGCFNSDCSFIIEVDSGKVLDESHGDEPDNHETNNVVEGICIG